MLRSPTADSGQEQEYSCSRWVGTCIDEPVSTIVADYDWYRRDPVRLVDLADYVHQWKNPSRGKSLLFLPYTVWSEQLLSLEDLDVASSPA